MNDQEKQASVPYFVHEGQMARMERIIKVMATVLVAALLLFIANNVIWMMYTEKQRTEIRAEVKDAGIHQHADQGADP